MKVTFIFILSLLISQVFPASGQEKKHSSKKITVTGTVTENKKPVRGAVIFVDTVFMKVATDEMGGYRVKADADAKVIIAAVPDKAFGRIEITDPASADIEITESLASAPPFVNSALKANQKQLTKITRINTYPNIYEMIRTEVPGVTVSGSSITIKQGHSFFGSSTPIFVVNGARVQSIDYIIPTQVKKIELLTGSQASMYSGVDGTPGVIKITLFTGGEK
jgi:TonB-dependent starch-binding outer membrane protein SusC